MSGADGSQVAVALHIHTLYSPCAETKLEAIIPYCREKGVDAIGITDHDTIAGALAVQAMTKDVRVIIGEEITTRQGEITGLFLEQEIEPGLEALETCERIKEQGGLVYIPHPFDLFKFHRLKQRILMKILDLVDIVEVFNGKASCPIFNRIAEGFAAQHRKIAAAGSDAHYLRAIDRALNYMEDFTTPNEFLQNLKSACLVTRKSIPLRAWWIGVKNMLREEGHKIRNFQRRR
jgi:hypothetical protein